MKLRLGISSCPNDTFAFHGLLSGAIDTGDLDFEVSVLDIQELNDRLRVGALDVGKVSFFAALQLAARYGVLPVGSAIGFGVGPLLLAARPAAAPQADSRVACPGADTTATLLLRCLHPEVRQLIQQNFATIMPALRDGQVDYGVVIHEGRFTFEQSGLHLVEDLGQSWEEQSGTPVPLGGLVARLDLGAELHARLGQLIGASLDHAHEHRDEAQQTMRRHAQELDDEVLWAHVELYVNEETRALGAPGRAALAALHRRAREVGVLDPDAAPLQLL